MLRPLPIWKQPPVSNPHEPSVELVVELQARGMRWFDPNGPGLSRIGGAGPSDHKAVTVGRHTVNVTENVAGEVQEGGKYFMVTTWDGTKWVSKRTWYATKKAAGATKDAVQ